MSDFLEGYKHVGDTDAVLLARSPALAPGCFTADTAVGPFLEQPGPGPGLNSPSLPSSPAPEPDRSVDTGTWRVLWIERTETRYADERAAVSQFFSEMMLGAQCSRPGLTVSNYVQRRLPCGVWDTVRSAERPEWMLSQ